MQKVIYSKIDFTDFDIPCVSEFYSYISDILENEQVQALKEYGQHMSTTRFQHSLNVAYYTYKICKKLHLNAYEATRAAMLHDLFLYDWRDHKDLGAHASVHPRKALVNAYNVCEVTPLMADSIVSHMWPLTIKHPVYKEGWVITVMDKLCASLEVMNSMSYSMKSNKFVLYTCMLLTYMRIN